MFWAIGQYILPSMQSRKDTPMPQDTLLTISVPEAGRRLAGLSKAASYAAAARGEFPIIKVGKLLRVPLRAFERMLDQATAK
jgi:hypothetical protein